jgi:two-component system, OmpR family, response regulator CpxR
MGVPAVQNTSENNRLLLIDDDVDLCSLISEFFVEHGFTVESVHDGGQGLALAFEGDFALVLLDVMMPVLDGFEVLRQLRRRSMIPIIMLTARIEERDRITGLDACADDYLPKPFGPEELLARIRAVLRRAGHITNSKDTTTEVAEICVNATTRQVWNRGKPVELTSTEFEILDLLIRSATRVISRDQLSAVLHQRPLSPYDRSLDVHISHLRKKIEGGGVVIRTVRGVGYLLSVEMETPA